MEENAPHNSFLYIDSYVIVKSAMSHVEYVLKGSLLQKDIQRRYSEFFLLREKIIERWPCIYIPELPPKQVIGSLEENFIKLRMRLLNHFLDRLSEIKDVFNGDEVKLFILYEENKKTLFAKLEFLTFPTLSHKYLLETEGYTDDVSLFIIIV